MAKRTRLSDDDVALFRRAAKGVTRARSDKIEPGRPTQKRKPLASSVSEPTDDKLAVAGATLPTSSPDQVLFVRGGLQRKALRKLRRGDVSLTARLDLHGMTVAQAAHAVTAFLARCHDSGQRCVHIIHGKGVRSNEENGRLRGHVDGWLRAHSDVVAFCSAQPKDGGTGAVYVLLKRAK